MKDNLKSLNEKKAEFQSEMETLLTSVKTEERAFTEEENAKFVELEKSIKLIMDTLAAIEKGRDLTEETPEDGGQKKEEETVKTEETRALEEREITAFANFIKNVVGKEERAETNLTMGDNGAIIPVTIANKIITKAYDMSTILSKATKYNTKGKLEIPVYGADASSNDITMAYANEFTELESKIGKFTAVELNNYLAGALAKLSNSLINNSDIDIVNKVVELMAEVVARFMEGEAIHGTVDKVTGCKGITLKVVTESATVITADELIKLKNKVKKTFRKNANWIMSNDTLTAVELLKDDNGRYLFTEDLTGEYDGKILGYPVEVSDNMEEIAAGKTPILFGDFSGLAIKQTKDLELQVLREKYATEHATGIVAWTEFDVKIEHLQKIAKLEIKTV